MAETVLLLAISKIGIALAKEVADQAIAQFAKHAVQLIELQGSMGRIMTELRVIHTFLCQKDIRSRGNQVYQSWLQDVRKAVYVMEDTVDEYLHLVGRQRDQGSCFYMKRSFSQQRSVLSLDEIASRVKETEKTLAHLSQINDRWITTTNSSGLTSILQSPQDLASISRCLDEEDLVGIEENKKKLVQWLGDGDQTRSIIVVHGMGGLGKTTLASSVYRREREKFNCHAWISVSQTYTIEDILRRLIDDIFKDQQNAPSNIATMDMTTLQDTLRSFLEQRKYLIVLDDVWTPQVYIDLSSTLVPNDEGSRIIITTRNAEIGHLTSPERALELKSLSRDDSWQLFCKKAFLNHECPTELKILSEQIVSKCEGLPLAIVSIGRLLSVREKTREEWKSIHDQLSWQLTNNPSLEHVRNVLHLSFIYLPTYLKSCFLYCSLFPEDYLLHRKKLIRLWIAEGFIKRRGQSTMEEVAEGYIKELIHMNMLQLVGKNSFDRIKLFRMHDVVRELAIDLCQRECFGTVYSDDDKRESKEMDYERRMVLHRLTDDINQPIISSLHRLRSVIAFDKITPSSSRVLPLIVNNSKYMSVLELNGLPIEKVPDAIGDLFNLRYLGLRKSKVKQLPNSIEKLSNLLTLDLYRSEILELPRGIIKLKKLRHLFAEKVNEAPGRDFRSLIGVHIHRGLEKLQELQTLQALEVQDEGSVKLLRELRQMRSIRIWGVKGRYCEELFESLRQMEFLSCLYINASDEEEVLQLDGMNSLPPNLQKLILKGKLAPASMLGTAAGGEDQNKNHPLYSMHLRWTQLAEDPLPSISKWKNLMELSFTRAYIGKQLVFLEGWFPNLQRLNLRDMPDLKHLEIRQGAITKLRALVLVDLRGMTEVPAGIEFLKPTLKHLAFGEITDDFYETLNQCSSIRGIKWWYNIRKEPVRWMEITNVVVHE